jgi:SAM-dependent methyltransferase
VTGSDVQYSGSTARASAQANHNATEWAAGKHVDAYATAVLTPVEVQILVRYREALSGRVLDLGCGAGRVLGYLVMIGADAHGVDLAPKMVEQCRRAVPAAHVACGDMSALGDCVEGRFDAIVAPDNLIDVFDDEERRRVLSGIGEFLAPDGLLIFSSHDLGWHEANPGPREWEARSPAERLRRALDHSPTEIVAALNHRRRSAQNRKRLGPLEQRHGDHAIVNDFPHDYSLLHYYIRRDDQQRQLEELGYELIECLDGRGDVVEPGGHGPRDHYTDNLHYIARLA